MVEGLVAVIQRSKPLKKIDIALGVEAVDLFMPDKVNFTTLIDRKDKLYRFDNIEESENFIAKIKPITELEVKEE